MKAQKKLIISLSAIWIMISLIALAVVSWVLGGNAEFTGDDSFIQREDSTIFVSDNTFGFGTLYRLDANGKVKNVLATKGRKFVDGWELNGICDAANMDDEGSFYAVMTTSNTSDHHVAMRVAKISDGLSLSAVTPKYRLHLDGKVTGISTDTDGILYVTELHGRGAYASVYEVEPDSLVDVSATSTTSKDQKDELNADPQDISDVRSARSGDADVFAQAKFDNNMLYTRLATAPFGENFEEPLDVKQTFDARTMSVGNRFSAIGIPGTLIAGVIVGGILLIIILVYTLYGRRRAIYRIAVFEIILFILTTGSFLSLSIVETGLKKEQFLRYETYALRNFGLYQIANLGDENFYRTEDYQLLRNDIEALIEDGAALDHRVDNVCVVDVTTGEIIADAYHHERQSLDFVYGTLALTAAKGNDRVVLTLPQGGWTATAISQPISGTTDYRAVGIFSHAGIGEVIVGTGQTRTWSVVLLFVFLSVAGTIFLLLESRDLQLLDDALASVASGKLEFDKPPRVMGWDMNHMWNSVHEIEKNIREVNRMQFMTYQAYYRFAPRGIEKILNKASIIDVKSGDAIRFSATIAFLSTVGQRGDGKDEMDRRNHFLQMVQSHCFQEDGIYVSGDSDLSVIRILFLDKACHSIRFGSELLMDMTNNHTFPPDVNTTVLLHHAPFVYGVAGSEEQATTFLIGRQADELAEYVDWFRRLGLHVILTESVRERESVAALRYIGFILLESAQDGRMNLYEALDAEDFDTRQGKKRTAKQFADALKLFYGKDFYIARNAFAAILQEVPKDMVAKWYLFECERLLNRADNHDFVGELHR